MRTIFQLAVGIVFGGVSSFAQDAEKAKHPDQPTVAGEARLGLTVSKPDEKITAQLPNLPRGIGFLVNDLEEDGPAAKAGLRKLDLLWKMNEQWLVNEGQLATLLRLSKPGDEAVLSVFREGRPLDLKVTLGEGKADCGAVTGRVLNDSVIRDEDGFVRIVNIEQKRAAFSNEYGTAEVYRVERGDAVRIVDSNGKVIFRGVMNGRRDLSMVPDNWKRQVCALRRGLDHALSAKAAPIGQPRPRIVEPPASKQE